MKRDMELIRKILLAIEAEYIDTWLNYSDLGISDYDLTVIAYHCNILYDAGLVSEYFDRGGDNHILYFGVGHLTWEGHELLDKIKSDTVWNRTKDTISNKGIPFVLDAVKQIATAITSAMIQSALQSY